MPFSRFQLFGNPFDNPAAAVERHIRARMLEEEADLEQEFPEAEIDDRERRAAMTRERMRRLGIR
ncbi:MAG TPA: hypothetical protein VH951_12905 [Dehalococcoidia bacterium]|jgi:hypothetical protein